jgi:pyridoxine kinase
MEQQKRAAAIHDISCFGRCSLTVALPVLSAAGIEASVIPTAVLSTHTGGFSGFTYRDLTDDILPIVKHWDSLKLNFDAIYTGFLGSFEQIEIVMEAIRILKGEGTLVAVDPVMADNGELYSLFPKEFPAGMRNLCAAADIIVPNMTEAALLLGEDYHEPPYSRDEIASLLKALCSIGPKMAVLTGVSYNEGRLGAASYDSVSGQFGYSDAPRVDGMYHGTGDVFASALVAAMLHGRSLEGAIESAVGFTVKSIERSSAAGSDRRYGVNFEAGLGEFAASLK